VVEPTADWLVVFDPKRWNSSNEMICYCWWFRNPYPIMYRFYTSQVVVWDFFHQQYHVLSSKSRMPEIATHAGRNNNSTCGHCTCYPPPLLAFYLQGFFVNLSRKKITSAQYSKKTLRIENPTKICYRLYPPVKWNMDPLKIFYFLLDMGIFHC